MEKKIRSLSEEKKIDLFSNSQEEVAKSVTREHIQSDALYDNVKLAVNNTFGKQVPLLLSGLSVAVKVALAAVAVLFIALVVIPIEQPTPTLSITPVPLSHDFGEIIQGEKALWQFSLRNTGEGTLEWEADSDQSWMKIYPRQGTGSDYITVQIDTAQLESRHYSGTLEIRSNGGNIAGDIDLTIIQGPVLSLSPDPPSHDFGRLVKGDSATWQFSIRNAGSGTLEWDVVSDQQWLTINPRYGTDSDYVTILVDSTDLEPGEFSGTLEIRSNGGNRAGDIDLTVIQGPILSLSPDPPSHDFGRVVKGDSATWQFFIRNAGSGTLEWDVVSDQQWLTINPRYGTDSDYVTVLVDTADLEPGEFSGTLEIRSNGGNRAGDIDLTAIQGPILSVSQLSHDFGQVVQGDSASWKFSIENAGGGVLEWEIDSDQPWITINPTIGVNSKDILVEVKTADLKEGTYRGNIIINSNDRRVTVTLEMNVIPPILLGPDLVISNFEVGSPTINPENSVELPVRVDITNQGDVDAKIFKMAARYSGSSGTYTVPFTVEGQDIWYPYTSAPLQPDDSVVFEGILTFHPLLHYETVTVWVIADSCSGDEFMPEYCRVDESNENNNNAPSQSVYMPGIIR
jgi:hypothetical protein